MAGRAKRRAVLADFARRAREREIGETALDYIADQLGSGETFRAICKTAKPALTEDTIRLTLYEEFGDDVVKQRLMEARRRGGHSLGEKGLEVAEAVSDKDGAIRARVEVGQLNWLAQRWNREELGEQRQSQGPTVNLNFGSLLLQAHKEIEAGRALPPAGDMVDAEVVVEADAVREGE